MQFVDLFAGLGCFHVALTRVGHTCVFASEIDKELCDLYERNYGIRPFGDITKINVNDIEKCINILTKLTPVEEITEDRYLLRLGNKYPIEIGYDKQRKILSEDVMRYSALIKLLSQICEMMKDEANFMIWIEHNKQ